MRCKKHYTDLSSLVGVCASCLRQRLFSLVAAQEHANAQAPPLSQTQTLDEEQNRNSETHPVFPHSVSPYITRRKSDNRLASNNNQHNSDRNRLHSLPDRRFFSTPQVGPAAGDYNPSRKKKQHGFIRFSLLSNLFRSKKRNEAESDSDPRVSISNSRGSCGGGGDSSTSAMSSPSWFSSIKSGGGSRKKQPFCYNESSSGAGVMRKLYCPDRGMSPVRYSDCGDADDEFYDGSSGYETCESRKQTPWRTPAHQSVRRGGGGGAGGLGKNVSGLNFCLSPLVRASPCRYWNQNGMPPTDGGDIRAPVKPHLSNTKSFCANRSRKLADFGRFNTNR